MDALPNPRVPGTRGFLVFGRSTSKTRDMSMLRRLRQVITHGVTDAALALAPVLTPPRIDRIELLARRWAPRLPGLGDNVAANMRALGVFSPAAHQRYFDYAAQHGASSLYILRAAATCSAADLDAVRRRTRATIQLDSSVAALREATAGGRGAVIMGPHLPNFVLALPRLNELAPLTIYMRYSRQRARHEAKLRWCRVTGMSWIIEPPTEGKTSRLAGMAAAVRDGRVVYITPDMARKRGDGTPVRFFGREVYLPAGAAVLAARAGAPLFQLLSEPLGDGQLLKLLGPALPPGAEGARGWIHQQMQWFADTFERFIIEHPPLWYSWADKRWTRLLAGDPELVGPPRSSAPADAPSHAPSGNVAPLPAA